MTAKNKKQTFKRIIFRREGELAERGLYAVEKTKDGDLRLFMDGNEVYKCQRVFHQAPLAALSVESPELRAATAPDTITKCELMAQFDQLPDALEPASILSVTPMTQPGLARCITTVFKPKTNVPDDLFIEIAVRVLENDLQGPFLHEIRTTADKADSWACVLLKSEPYTPEERQRIHGQSRKKAKRKVNRKGGRNPSPATLAILEQTRKNLRINKEVAGYNEGRAIQTAIRDYEAKHGTEDTPGVPAIRRHLRKERKATGTKASRM